MENLMNADDLCRQLKISKGLLYQLRAEGLPHYRLRRAVRYSADEVQQWLQSHNLSKENEYDSSKNRETHRE